MFLEPRQIPFHLGRSIAQFRESVGFTRINDEFGRHLHVFVERPVQHPAVARWAPLIAAADVDQRRGLHVADAVGR